MTHQQLDELRRQSATPIAQPPTTPAPMVVSEEAVELRDRIRSWFMKETFYIPHEEDPVLAMCSKAINAATEKLTRELDESNRIISEDSKQILALGEQIQTLTARVKELEEENARLTDFVMKL